MMEGVVGFIMGLVHGWSCYLFDPLSVLSYTIRGNWALLRTGLIVDEEMIPCIWPKSVKAVGGTVVEAKGGKKSGPAKGKGKK